MLSRSGEPIHLLEVVYMAKTTVLLINISAKLACIVYAFTPLHLMISPRTTSEITERMRNFQKTLTLLSWKSVTSDPWFIKVFGSKMTQ